MQSATVRAYEARIVDLKEAHAAEVQQLMRLVDMLAEQVEYLRATGGRPQPLRPAGGIDMRPQEFMQQPGSIKFEPASRVSDEEDDVRAMADAGLLDAAELTAALADLGIEV